MAIPRITPQTQKPFGRTVRDVPEYRAELDKLARMHEQEGELKKRDIEAGQKLKAANLAGARDNLIALEAAAIVTGTPVVTEELPDLGRIQRGLLVIAEAITMQSRITEEKRQPAAAIVGVDYVDEDKRRVLALLNQAQAFIEEFEGLEQFRQSYRQAIEGTFAVLPMRDISLNKRTIPTLKHDLEVFKQAITEFDYQPKGR